MATLENEAIGENLGIYNLNKKTKEYGKEWEDRVLKMKAEKACQKKFYFIDEFLRIEQMLPGQWTINILDRPTIFSNQRTRA